MSEDITAGIVRILSGRSVGTGFVVSDAGLIATCAHVLGSPRPEKATVIFHASNEQREATVETEWWSDVDAEDVAILRVDGGLPSGARSLPLGSSTGVKLHDISTFGFPDAGDVTGVGGYGKVIGRESQFKPGQPLLQLRSSEITSGFSGAPVWDELRQRVIGMVVEAAKVDSIGKMAETAFATPIETLQAICTQLQISDINPYHGLTPFTQADAGFFFGRKQDVDRLVNKIRLDPRFLVVLGPSGSGKTSLVQAGLLPKLGEAAVPGSDRWGIIIARPADDPFKQLAAQGLPLDAKNLPEAVQAWLNQHPKQTRLVLIIDQFEELLATCPDGISQDFLTQLTLLLDAHLPATIMLVMRDDFYNRFAQNTKLVDWLKQTGGMVTIPATLKWDDLVAIVQEPAKAVGLRFEEGLIEEIVEEAIVGTTSEDGERVGRSAILPLLEFALTELDERHEEGVLTFNAYDKIGKVTGGLSQWAQQSFDSLEDERKKQLASRIFTDLVYLSDESQGLSDSRRPRSLQSLYRNEGEREDVYRLVQRLVNARLLVTSSNMQNNEVMVEIIHDALLKEWGLLKQWLQADRPFLLWHQELEKKVSGWTLTRPNETRYSDWLLQGSNLSKSEGWMEIRAADLSEAEQAFIRASRYRQNKQDLRWKQLYEKAEQQRQEAERLRLEAVQQREEVEKQRQEAERQREEAERQRQEAVRQREEVEKQRQVALARQLTAQAELLRDQHGSLLQRSILLALESLQRSASPEADQALHLGLGLLPRFVTRMPAMSEVNSGLLNANGSSLVLANKDGSVEVWEVSSGRRLARLLPEGGVKQVVFSLDGSCFATIGVDSVVYVWETNTGRQIARLFNGSSVNAVMLNRNGRYLVTMCGDGIAWVWEVVTGRLLARLSHEGMVRSAAFSIDGRYVATASIDGYARVWETVGARELARLNHGRSVNAVAFSPNNRYLATASDDNFVRSWVWGTGSNAQPTLLSHEDPVNALVFNPDGSYLATASRDHTARVWETATGRQVARMNHSGSVDAIAFSSDGRYVATTSADRTVGVWEATSGYRLICLPHKDVDYQEGNYIHAVAFSQEGRYLVTASVSGNADMWEIISDRLFHKRGVSAVAFNVDGSYLATASEDGTAGIWEVKSGYRHLELAHGSKVWAVAFSPDGRYLATGGEDGSVGVWETLGGRQPFRLAHTRNVNAVAFSPDGNYLATASSDYTAKLWETSSGGLLFSFPHNDSVNALAFSPDGRFLATASGDTCARIWETASGRQLATLPHKLIVNTVVFSPDGRYVATASWDHTAGIWETVSGRQFFALSHDSKVWSVAFSPDSRYVATASKDRTARVWEMVSGKQIACMTHDDSVNAVAFSPDGTCVATASTDRTAAVWEIASSRQLSYLTHDDNVNAITFNPDGRYVATASSDNTARLWLWQSRDLIAEAQNRLTRNLTQAEWRQYLGEEPYRKTCPNLVEEFVTESVRV